VLSAGFIALSAYVFPQEDGYELIRVSVMEGRRLELEAEVNDEKCMHSRSLSSHLYTSGHIWSNGIFGLHAVSGHDTMALWGVV